MSWPSRAPRLLHLGGADVLQLGAAQLLAIALGAGADVLVEDADHLHRSAKAALGGDQVDLLIGGLKQHLRVRDAPSVDLLQDRSPQMILEARLQAAQRK